MATEREVKDLFNATAFDKNGDKLGGVKEVFIDDDTGQPTFVEVGHGLFGMNSSLVPMRGHRLSGDDLQLAFDKDRIKDAPEFDTDNHLTPDDQRNIYDHYGVTGSEDVERYRGDDRRRADDGRYDDRVRDDRGRDDRVADDRVRDDRVRDDRVRDDRAGDELYSEGRVEDGRQHRDMGQAGAGVAGAGMAGAGVVGAGVADDGVRRDDVRDDRRDDVRGDVRDERREGQDVWRDRARDEHSREGQAVWDQRMDAAERRMDESEIGDRPSDAAATVNAVDGDRGRRISDEDRALAAEMDADRGEGSLRGDQRTERIDRGDDRYRDDRGAGERGTRLRRFVRDDDARGTRGGDLHPDDPTPRNREVADSDVVGDGRDLDDARDHLDDRR